MNIDLIIRLVIILGNFGKYAISDCHFICNVQLLYERKQQFYSVASVECLKKPMKEK